MNSVRSTARRARSRSYENSTGPPASPSPHTFSRHAPASMRGVEVWLRTKKRSTGVSRPVPRSAAKFVSAFVPRIVNSSGGSGLTIPGAASAPAAEAVPAAATPREPAAAPIANSFSRSRRSTPAERARPRAHCRRRVRS